MKKSELHSRIEQALRAERPLRQAPPGFAERVIEALPSRSLREQQGDGARAPQVRQSIWPRLALAAALGLITFVVWRGFAPQEAQAPALAQNPPVPENLLPGARLAPVSLEQVQAFTAKIDQPLEKELERVMADTRNAIRFVASNFMPEPN